MRGSAEQQMVALVHIRASSPAVPCRAAMWSFQGRLRDEFLNAQWFRMLNGQWLKLAGI